MEKYMTCPSCEELTICVFAPDPYASEIYGNKTLVWKCINCRQESCDDI